MIIDTNEHNFSGPMGQSLPIKAASLLFGAAVNVRNALYDSLPFLSYQADRPVISIGGLRAGGTGKTPTALMVGEYLSSKGFAVAFLSRGYRREDRRLRIVKPYETVSWLETGDEPWLLHERLPQSWLGIGADRCAASARLSPLLPQRAVFVLDDGFQHRAVKRDLDIVCLHDSLLDDRLIPWGWLREPAGSLSRARAALIIGTIDNTGAMETLRSELTKRFPGLCTAVLFQEMGQWTNAGDGHISPALPFKNPLLVCGIARPERFVAMVRKEGITPCAERIFPDHHRYAINDFGESPEVYLKGIITTEKDAVRLKTIQSLPAEKVWYCGIKLRFADEKQQKDLFSLIDSSTEPKEIQK